MMFPFDSGEGCFGLAVADPTDIAAQRGAQIVLGGPIMVAVASFEEIGEVLSARLGREEEGSGAASAGQASGAAEESVDSLRDLASGAPVVRAVNDLLEKAIDLRASDIHIEPMRNALNVRMRVDGLLRTVPAPAHALPQALISRIKITLASTFPSGGCRRTARPDSRWRARTLISASPRCRPNTANPR